MGKIFSLLGGLCFHSLVFVPSEGQARLAQQTEKIRQGKFSSSFFQW